MNAESNFSPSFNAFHGLPDIFPHSKLHPTIYYKRLEKLQSSYYFKSLQKAKKLDNQLTQHNVETLLLSGKRVSYIDKAGTRKKIQIIDRISLAVFGRTEFFDLMPAGEQSITLDGKDDLNKLIEEFN